MATEERATGAPNHVYNAVTALSNILEAGVRYDTYISDAEQAGTTSSLASLPTVPTGGSAPS